MVLDKRYQCVKKVLFPPRPLKNSVCEYYVNDRVTLAKKKEEKKPPGEYTVLTLCVIAQARTQRTGMEEGRWIDDNESNQCFKCGKKFQFLIRRRHHCRKCGKIYCIECCNKFTKFIPGMMIMNKEGNGIVKNENVKFRTCLDCYKEIKMLKIALGIKPDYDAESDENVENEDGNSDNDNSGGASAIGIDQNEENENENEKECPICGKLFSGTENRETHIEQCLTAAEFGSPVAKGVGQRMLKYVYEPRAGEEHQNNQDQDQDQDQDQGEDEDECVICLEPFEAGARVARLACLCRFHVACIEQWRSRCGGVLECPVHRFGGVNGGSGGGGGGAEF